MYVKRERKIIADRFENAYRTLDLNSLKYIKERENCKKYVKDVERILNTEGMIRSRRKIEGVIHNARCFQEIRKEWGSFSRYIWSFTKEKTYLYTGHQKGELPARNGLSDRISQDLKKRGMKYMGSVTVYSHLQACGIINDHLDSCFRFQELLEISDTIRKRREKEQ